MAWLIAAVGGQKAAAQIANVSNDTVNNMRKPGWKLTLEPAFALCQEVGMSLDWLATGWVAPAAEGLTRLKPLLTVGNAAPSRVQDGEANYLGFQNQFPADVLDIPARGLRYAFAGDDGMAPVIPAGAFLAVEANTPATLVSGTYLVVLDRETLPRRLNHKPDGSFELAADSDPNWRYPLPATPPRMHRIRWCGRPL